MEQTRIKSEFSMKYIPTQKVGYLCLSQMIMLAQVATSSQNGFID